MVYANALFEDQPKALVTTPLPRPEVSLHVRESFQLKATAYNAVAEQTDATPDVTAIGTPAEPGVAAASRDVLDKLPFGTRVQVVEVLPSEGNPNGCGGSVEQLQGISPHEGAEFRIEDTTHFRKRGQIDFLMSELHEAKTWGVCKVTVVRVDE